MNITAPVSDATIRVDLSVLTREQIAMADEFRGLADLRINPEHDGGGRFSLIEMRPRRGMPNRVATVIGLPRVELDEGLEWAQLEAWNNGTPLRLSAEARDAASDSFEISFSPLAMDLAWDGWKTFRVPVHGPEFVHGVVSGLGREVVPPLQIRCLVVTMRQGLGWRVGVRALTLKPLAGHFVPDVGR